jgi:hypothetical protein
VGTGGATLYAVSRPAPNSEAVNAGDWGVLRLRLKHLSYQWDFIPASGGTFQDSGSANCVQ